MARTRALQEALREEEARRRAEVEEATRRKAEEEARRKAEEEEAKRQAEEEAKRKVEEEEAKRKAEEEAKRQAEEEAIQAAKQPLDATHASPQASAKPRTESGGQARGRPADTQEAQTHGRTEAPRRPAPKTGAAEAEEGDAGARAGKRSAAPKGVVEAPRKAPPSRARGEERRRTGKLTITQALDDEGAERTRSLASVRRARERERQRLLRAQGAQERPAREITVPEAITVQELANRMAERGANVIKALMKMGVMATINQPIDQDTAELIVEEFGHKIKRVADSDVELGIHGTEDSDEELQRRPPVVTIMGHVDHGKTSLLDALRETDVVGGEAGGITQHIGAYQVTMSSGDRITFIDTPGHAAFTEMRARGANVTDIVVLVVAADDGIKPQTIEALRHAQAAKVPIIVAINKVDKPDADPDRVRSELLNYNLQVEAMGGDVLDVEVSAKQRQNLDKLEEAILLQAEMIELRANPNRTAQGVIVEAKMERGRGSVATLLVQKGTARVGDIFVAGAEWGRIRALIDDRGRKAEEAGPASPVEVLGLNGTPMAGDEFIVVADEQKAREISDFRQRTRREKEAAAQLGARGTLEQMFDRIQAGEAKELPLVLKADVQGSVEAIVGSLEKLATEEVKVRVLHTAVGGINESDVTLARASDAIIVGFNVRANPQAREAARRDGVDIRYYSIIYDVVDDMKKLLSGMLAPQIRETLIGNAEIREVFSITKVGKVAGCYVTEGHVSRGNKVRLLRDDVVIHEGKLKTLRRFKDEVKEVQSGYECGMAFENYQDIQVGDVIECFEVEEVAREL